MKKPLNASKSEGSKGQVSYHRKIGASALVLAVGALLVGCAPAFQGVGSGLNAGYSSVADGVGQLVPVSAPGKVAGWLQEEGFLADQPKDIDVYFQSTIKIPYGWVYTAASVASRLASPMACQVRGLEAEANPHKAYAPGEMPCGRFTSGGYKQVAVFDVPQQDTKSGRFTAKVNGFSLPIWISRQQFGGVYKESRLDSRSTESITSSTSVGDDVSIRYEPREDGTGMKLHLCATMPGMEVTIPQTTVRAKASAKLGFAKVSYATDLTVNFGQARFDYARGCFATEVAFNGDSLVPQFQFTATEVPHVSNATYKGLHVRIGDWWLRFLDNVMNWFRASLRKSLTKQAVREVNSYADKEFETGAWFVKAHGHETLNSLSDTVNRASMRAMRSTGLPLSGAEMRSLLERQCGLVPMFKGVNYDFAAACKRVLAGVKVAILPFYRDPGMAADGCYDHFANIHQSRDENGKWKWWAKRCGFAMQLQVRVVAGLTDEDRRTLEETLQTLSQLDTWLELARAKLGWSKDDEAILLFVFDEAFKNGEKLGSLDDLARIAPRYRGNVEDKLKGWATQVL